MALMRGQVAAIAPAHPLFGSMKPYLTMFEARCFVSCKRTAALTLVNPLFLPMLALIDRLGHCREGQTNGRGGRQSQDQPIHMLAPCRSNPRRPSGDLRLKGRLIEMLAVVHVASRTTALLRRAARPRRRNQRSVSRRRAESLAMIWSDKGMNA